MNSKTFHGPILEYCAKDSDKSYSKAHTSQRLAMITSCLKASSEIKQVHECISRKPILLKDVDEIVLLGNEKFSWTENYDYIKNCSVIHNYKELYRAASRGAIAVNRLDTSLLPKSKNSYSTLLPLNQTVFLIHRQLKCSQRRSLVTPKQNTSHDNTYQKLLYPFCCAPMLTPRTTTSKFGHSLLIK